MQPLCLVSQADWRRQRRALWFKNSFKGETAQPGANVSDLWSERPRRSPSRRASIEDSCWPFSVEIKMSSRGQQCLFQLFSYRVPKDCIVYLNLQIGPRTNSFKNLSIYVYITMIHIFVLLSSTCMYNHTCTLGKHCLFLILNTLWFTYFKETFYPS